MSKPLQLQLTNFEGPLDLLLHLVRQAKLDIYDIPIAQITDQYMHYLHQMQELNLQIAGDYFVMASTLLKFKSQQLLPHNEYVAEDDEDPAAALSQQLVEYAVYQKIAGYLGQKADEGDFVAAKDPTVPSGVDHLPLAPGQASQADLLRAMSRVVARLRLRQPASSHMAPHHFQVQRMKKRILAVLAKHPLVSFAKLAGRCENSDQLVGLFLAVLTLYGEKTIMAAQQGDDLSLRQVTNKNEA